MNHFCRINLNQPAKPIVAGHLHLGGQDPLGNTLGVNSYYLTRNGKPFFVISGEFHYARFPQMDWEEELCKIKAGGINTVATYLFWNYHEEAPEPSDAYVFRDRHARPVDQPTHMARCAFDLCDGPTTHVRSRIRLLSLFLLCVRIDCSICRKFQAYLLTLPPRVWHNTAVD